MSHQLIPNTLHRVSKVMATTHPLRIAVDRRLNAILPLDKWREKGYTIEEVDFAGFDLVLGPTCHFFDPVLLPYLDAALKRARKRRKEAAI